MISLTSLKAKVLTFKSQIDQNRKEIREVADYKELVHGAWNEVMEVKNNVQKINETVITQDKKMQEESAQRESTDNMLMELFHSGHCLQNI